jgi:prepilin-type N-terminal cleavage/methylation domain-containing protein
MIFTVGWSFEMSAYKNSLLNQANSEVTLHVFLRRRAGFSLVELSIVLVILGLLVGGVLTGKSLIRAAELRAVTTEFQAFNAAATIFKEKYMALAGDMNNATKFWGDNATHCSDGIATNNGVPGTCNGNGNGQLEYGAADAPGEIFLFWNQLSNAGLISGQYTGITGSGWWWAAIPAQNVPESKVTGAGYSIMPEDLTYGTNADHLAYNMKNSLVFGIMTLASAWYPMGGLSPQEAWGIDKKTDDGQAGRGNIITSMYPYGCVTPNTGVLESSNFDISYNTAITDNVCGLIFKDVF